jgi:hypothetical protein
MKSQGLQKKLWSESGAGSRTRTDTMLPLPDFESGASTNFAIPAGKAEKILITYFNLIRLYLTIVFTQHSCFEIVITLFNLFAKLSNRYNLKSERYLQ